MTATLAAHGISIDLPERWEGRLYLRAAPGTGDPGVHFAAYGAPDERANPVLHLANFALPAGRGDFGTGAVEKMGGQHAFCSLVEFGEAEVGTALYSARGFPRLTVRDFAPNQLQRRLPGQLGCQRFFTEQARAFCLYVVLGSQTHAVSLVQEVHAALARLKVGARWQQRL